uniref:Cystine knot toxin n=1 Tax=Dolomedes sulfureus TaxID=492288 RepID=A0A0P0DM92_9ARAC|nr:cystine knot toxin [Dolomedes sulfureus]
MKIVFVFISVLYLVHSISLDEEIEAAELLDEVDPVQDSAAELLQAVGEVKEEARSCVSPGQVCKDDCDCCVNNNYCHCPFWGAFGANSCTCIFGDNIVCKKRMGKCKRNRPQKCPTSRSTRRRG